MEDHYNEINTIKIERRILFQISIPCKERKQMKRIETNLLNKTKEECKEQKRIVTE